MPEAAGPNRRLPAVLRRPDQRRIAEYPADPPGLVFDCLQLWLFAYPPRSVPPQPIGLSLAS